MCDGGKKNASLTNNMKSCVAFNSIQYTTCHMLMQSLAVVFNFLNYFIFKIYFKY